MATVLQQRSARNSPLTKWVPLVVLTLAATTLTLRLGTSWILMWALAFAIFVGLKILTLSETEIGANVGYKVAYLFGWPGMDAQAFLNRSAAPPQSGEVVLAAGKTAAGLGIFFAAVLLTGTVRPLLAGLIAMIGVAFILHFGLFHLLSCFWRGIGISAQPIMRAPILAASLTDFWGRRWNTAFRDVAHRHVFRPLAHRQGPVVATLGGFLFSGVIHDIVISLPAGAGGGLPTLYFMIQGIALLGERRLLGSAPGIARRCFALLTVTLPLPLLFHTPFLERIVVPMLLAVKEVLL